MGKFCLLFDILGVEKMHLDKDFGKIPLYMNRLFNIDTEIVIYENLNKNNIPDDYCGIRIKKIKTGVLDKIKKLSKFSNSITNYLKKESKNIDYLMLFHLKAENLKYAKIYKQINPKGKIYLKLDIDERNFKNFKVEFEEKTKTRYFTKNNDIKLKINLINIVDVISVETKFVYNEIKEIFNKNNNIIEKILYSPNGFDKEAYKKNIKVPCQKEDIIVTVGRIGTIQKNNEMLLESVKGMELKQWKIYFIGPIEKSFMKKIDEFYKKFPVLKEKVIFTGSIEEKMELYEWYNRAKVFVLTSKWEGFPLVFSEALYFGNYIVSTKVGADNDITDGGRIGKQIEIDDVETLKYVIKEIIDGKTDLELKYDEIIKHSREYFIWEPIVKKIGEKLGIEKREKCLKK